MFLECSFEAFRPAYKPRSVQAGPAVYAPFRGCHPASPALGNHLSGPGHCWPAHAAYPGLERVEQTHRPCLALLPAGVAWPPALLRAPVVSYTAFSPSPGVPGNVLLCGPFPAGRPAPDVIRRRALWSADFPHPAALAGRDRPAGLNANLIISDVCTTRQ